jgi:decaprenyl-phosphate phosphoribosyltransferase
LTVPSALRLLRPQQWIKNAFVIAPLFFTPGAMTLPNIIVVLLGTLSFCAVSSAVYIVNDYLDRDADRRHPEKSRRPLAAGTVSVGLAGLLLAGLLAGGFGIALTLSPPLGLVLLAYLAVNLSYSIRLKQIAILDVLLVASGFVLRVEGGATLINVRPSVWILICTGLLALFLALAKRRDDLVKQLDQDHRKALAGYTIGFVDTSLTVTVGALLASYLVYTTDPQVIQGFGTDRLYLTAPFVIAGVLRYLQVTLVEQRSGSPTTIALTDRFLIISMLGWLLTFGVLLYG